MAVGTSSVAGITAGRNPLHYESSDPIVLFIFQTVIIICFCQLLHFPLSKLKQPKVIAEVLTGIILGPSVFGHIPHFTSTVFPAASLPGLTLVANMGLILFLFIVGMEVDIQFVKRNLKIALTVGLFNMLVPFGLGCILAIGLYNDYHPDGVKFTTFMVFIAVAMCITAFPVLARILTELRLLQDRIGTIVLAAGITNDVVGWMLLALSVTLANAENGVNTIYILLLMFGWLMIICYPVRWALRWCLVKMDDLENGPSQLSTCMILIMVFISSFYTDIIGIHPIFGAFLIGCIVPRDYGYVIRITEKIEDLVTVIIIPLYFTLAGLKCNLSSLNRGKDWGYIICIIVVAMLSKILAGSMAAKVNGLYWRESVSVGVLMSCKGIVEIVVLTTGLSAGIISQKVFSMFIVMALVCTFFTSPLTMIVYPVWYRDKVKRFRAGEIDWDENLLVPSQSQNLNNIETFQNFKISRVIPVVEKLKDVNDLVGLLHFLVLKSADNEFGYPIETYGISLKKLSQRFRDIINASNQLDDIDDDPLNSTQSDSLLLVLKIFSDLNGNSFDSSMKFYSDGSKVSTIIDLSHNKNDFILLPLSMRADRNEVHELAKRVKCNLGLFLNNLNPVLLDDSIDKEDDALTLAYSSQNQQKLKSLIYDSLSLILINESVSVDLLSIHIFLKFVSSLKPTIPSTIYIMGEQQTLSDELVQLIAYIKTTEIYKDIIIVYSDKVDGDFIHFVTSDESLTMKSVALNPLFISSLFHRDVLNIETLINKSQFSHFNLLICNNNNDEWGS